MVHVRTVGTSFHARVIAARLGADGIPTQLRGNTGGPYPFGAVSIWVDAGDADEAAELLLADEVEAAFTEDQSDPPVLVAGRWRPRQLVAAAGLVLVALWALAAHLIWS